MGLNLLEITDMTGHLSLEWSPDDPTDVERARAEIERLKAAGYSFFSVVGTDDPLAVGKGKLILEHLADPAKTLAPESTVPTKLAETYLAAAESTSRKGRGPGKRAVAIPQQRGG